MSNLREQTNAKMAAGRKKNPEFMNGVDDIINKAKALQQGENALKVGQEAPNFEIPNHKGEIISLNSLLNKGPVIVVFYRGNWCPYCNLQLRALQAKLNEFKTFGANLVAISAQVPDESTPENEINDIEFNVLSDQDAKVAKQYGLAWKMPEFLLNHMKIDRNLDLEQINNGNGNIIAIPATFIIGKDNVIQWNYVNIDYRVRSEPDEIIESLKKIV